ncbi:MAG: outer membrane beta-barrel protein [Bacteroidota bacterium]
MHRSLHHITRRLALVLLLIAPASAFAQFDAPARPAYSNTDGLFLHLRSGGHGIAFNDAGDDSGGSIGLRVGYGLSRRVTLYLGFEGGSLGGESRLPGMEAIDDSGLAYLELGGRYHFRPGHRFVPYADAALFVMGAGADLPGDDVTYAGAGLSAGAGALYFVTPRVALEGGATFSGGRLFERELDGRDDDIEIGMAGVRMHVGVTFYPFR